MDSLRTDFDCDIYVTGSNIGLHSQEYPAGTSISNNFVEVELFPLSFCEFLYFHNFEMKEEKDSLGGIRRQISDKRGKSYSVREVFDAYMKFGGIPSIADICWDQEKALVLLEDACSSVIVHDILEREDRGRITDFTLLREIMLLLAGNIGSSISISSISNTLAKKEFLKYRKRKGSPSVRTVQRLINALIESDFFYNVKCFDIKKNRYLHTLGKFYIADIGLRNGLLGYQDCGREAVLENIVYFELLRRGYTVSTGKIDHWEIDFIASKAGCTVYLQVMETMTKESIGRDKLTPLMKIGGNCKKMILSLESDLCFNYEEIQFANLTDWLID